MFRFLPHPQSTHCSLGALRIAPCFFTSAPRFIRRRRHFGASPLQREPMKSCAYNCALRISNFELKNVGVGDPDNPTDRRSESFRRDAESSSPTKRKAFGRMISAPTQKNIYYLLSIQYSLLSLQPSVTFFASSPLRNIVALLAWSASHCSLFLHLSTSLHPPQAALRCFALSKGG